jgi:hypothetical protein
MRVTTKAFWAGFYFELVKVIFVFPVCMVPNLIAAVFCRLIAIPVFEAQVLEDGQWKAKWVSSSALEAEIHAHMLGAGKKIVTRSIWRLLPAPWTVRIMKQALQADEAGVK